MSSKKRRKEVKEIRDKYPGKTLEELYIEGLIPGDLHLSESVDKNKKKNEKE